MALFSGSEVVAFATFRFGMVGIAFRLRSLVSSSVRPADFEVVILNHECDRGEKLAVLILNRHSRASAIQNHVLGLEGTAHQSRNHISVAIPWRNRGDSEAILVRFSYSLFLNSGHIPIQNRLQLTSGV